MSSSFIFLQFYQSTGGFEKETENKGRVQTPAAALRTRPLLLYTTVYPKQNPGSVVWLMLSLSVHQTYVSTCTSAVATSLTFYLKCETISAPFFRIEPTLLEQQPFGIIVDWFVQYRVVCNRRGFRTSWAYS